MTSDIEVFRMIAEASKETARQVRAAVIADLRGLVERAKSCDRSLYHVDGQSLECLIDELESQQS